MWTTIDAKNHCFYYNLGSIINKSIRRRQLILIHNTLYYQLYGNNAVMMHFALQDVVLVNITESSQQYDKTDTLQMLEDK